jgi:hypothetical protein
MNVFIRAMTRIFSFGERRNVPSFTPWKYSYHCTHKHSLFVYYITLYKTIKIMTLYKIIHDTILHDRRLHNTTQRYATLYDTI